MCCSSQKMPRGWRAAADPAMTATKTKRAVEPATTAKSHEEFAPMWDVVVWNDPVNLMTYVVYVLQRIFGYNRELATKLMLEVHHQGRSIVATEAREKV